MSNTRITQLAKPGKLYEGTKVSWDGTQLITKNVDGSDLTRTTMSASEVDALVNQLKPPAPTPTPTPVPEPTPTPTPTPSGAEGKVHIFRPLQSDMDPYLTSATSGDTSKQNWLERFERFRVYMNGKGATGWNADKGYAQGWLNKGWCYHDVMVATYNRAGEAFIADEHYLWDKPPTDPTRKRLYVNWGCANGTCPQWAADLGNPAIRKRYVDNSIATAKTAGGLFIDDANFWISNVVCDGNRNFVRPWNPRTNAPMTDNEWADGMLQVVKDCKAALPDPYEVVINTVFFHGPEPYPSILSIPQAKAALAVVDGWEIERGFGDTGYTGDTPTTSYNDGMGRWGFETAKVAIDYAHSVGTFIIHDVQSTALGRVYPQACYLLFTNGKDYYGHPDMKPDVTWDSLWNMDLGAAKGPAVKGTDYIWRRSFERGNVTVDPVKKTATIA